MKISLAFPFQLMIPLVLLSCSAKTSRDSKCASVKAIVSQRGVNDRLLPEFLRKYDAPGGELLVEFRKDDILGSATHQKSCSFFLEPSQLSSKGGIFWTAGHCLDASRDSQYRLRFYIDVPTGYVEIPILSEPLQKLQKFRQLISKKLSPSAQLDVLSSLKQRDVDYSESNNARDICLESIKSGRTFFHEPLAGMNQVSCFLYQDLRLVEFQFPDDLNQSQRSVVSFMIERAKRFDESNIISLAGFLTNGETTKQTSVFRQLWLNSYKSYVEYRENENFLAWVERNSADCPSSNVDERSDVCKGYADAQQAISDAGLSAQRKIIAAASSAAFAAEYLERKRAMVDLWKFYVGSTVTIGGAESRAWERLDIATNYNFDNGLRTFSALSPSLFVGLGWGATIDESGKSRDRVGGATYNWNPAVNEMFFYLISPKSQREENLGRGYGQLKLSAGDSGSMLLAGGLPMAVLATVDGEKTSGGASVLPLPSPAAEEGKGSSAGTSITSQANVVTSANGGDSGTGSAETAPIAECL